MPDRCGRWSLRSRHAGRSGRTCAGGQLHHPHEPKGTQHEAVQAHRAARGRGQGPRRAHRPGPRPPVRHHHRRSARQGRVELTTVETNEYETLRSQIAADEKRYDTAKTDLGELQRAAADEDSSDTAAGQTTQTPAARAAEGDKVGSAGAPEQRGYDQQHRVTAEKRTYSRDTEQREGVSFINDLLAATLDRSNYDAAERLARHMKEERVERGASSCTRAVGTGAFAGLTVPQYLTDLYAPAVAGPVAVRRRLQQAPPARPGHAA
jgi:hypothetical protein